MQVYRCIIRLSPYLRLALVRWVYNIFANKNRSEKNIFLNYGYYDERPISLDPRDEPNRLFIQLYLRAVQAIDLHGKDLAEIGCGQGAGGVFLVQHKGPRSYIGIDLSEKAIAFCQDHNTSQKIRWMQGCADKIPIPNHSVDVVINIESSHLYPSMPRFLSEVHRILRPNGYLAFADIRQSLTVEALEKDFSASGLEVLERSDISAQVLESLTRLSDRRKAYINATYARIWRPAAGEISAVKGSSVYNGFISGQKKYLCYLLQKQ